MESRSQACHEELQHRRLFHLASVMRSVDTAASGVGQPAAPAHERDVLAPESTANRGQRFQVSRAANATWGDGLRPYFQYRDLGIKEATSAQLCARCSQSRFFHNGIRVFEMKD
eukprot:SAG11_NODE_1114_length_5808_cov_12.177965_7_plen_114_part_00